jgi:pilus assembly protein CpaB
VVGVAGYILPGTHVDVLVTLHLANIPDPVTATILQDVQVLAIGQKIEPDPEGKPAPATVVTLLLNPSDAEKIDLASSQGAIHFVLRNGSDSGQPTQTPAMMTQLGGLAIPPAEKPHKAMMAAAKPYQVETFMGPNVKTDNFQ